ncbi:MAG: hypothetical protein QRY74_02880 [Chlamydia sp.]
MIRILLLSLSLCTICYAEERSPWIAPLFEPVFSIQASSITGYLDQKKMAGIDLALEGKVVLSQNLESRLSLQIGMQGKSRHVLSKFRIMVQKQIISDICPISPKPLALSLITDVSLTSKKRAKSLLFLDKASFETGVGMVIGRHFLLQESDRYLQLSGTIHCSKGNSNHLLALYGVSARLALNNRVQIATSFQHGFSHGTLHKQFQGKQISLKQNFREFSCNLDYVIARGSRLSFGFIRRCYTSHFRAISCEVRYVIPISL